jgi:hypothetical protein
MSREGELGVCTTLGCTFLRRLVSDETRIDVRTRQPTPVWEQALATELQDRSASGKSRHAVADAANSVNWHASNRMFLFGRTREGCLLGPASGWDTDRTTNRPMLGRYPERQVG